MVTHEILCEMFAYDKETGVLTRLTDIRYNAKKGMTITHVDKTTGYVSFNIKGRLYYAHRVAWFYVTKEWPDKVDHINGVRNDNRWCNLRNGSHAQNHQNIKAARSHNQSGFLGAHKAKDGRFTSEIILNGVRMYLGTFATPEEANAAYLCAKRKLHEFNTL